MSDNTPDFINFYLEPGAILPARSNPSDAGFDLFAMETMPEVVLHPGERYLMKIGVYTAIPDGYYGRIAPRSGLSLKSGLDILGGVVDTDYRGELGVILLNTGTRPITFKGGDRIAQLILEKIAVPIPEQVTTLEDLGTTDRGAGGYGSTGR